ncbi:beta-glucosidase 18-like isoform X1 [Lycium ferocissimum]|uniref:beta-glucosidase 18-like isoform X1 n=1 Tax=Lycium ferocissimum TaxID=112874 RepID=UPI002814C78A|nr:beta-glucosidase 18-like isoform X1 [Lycium ferocissimum]
MKSRSNYFSCFFLLCLLLFVSVNSLEEQHNVKSSQFPDGFLFGATTSAYQIEGAFLEDGKGLSNWDVFSHTKGRIKNGDNGDIADDHYHRFQEDVELMHSIGLTAYRFSISWSRVVPRGRSGKVNFAGVTFYSKLIDSLLLKGITPFVTVSHHDHPQELEERYGGWLDPIMQEEFTHFAQICFERFGDRVKHWITINEPNILAEMGYVTGNYPPAHCSRPFGNCSAGNSDTEPLIVMHNMLLAHAKAAKLYRDHFQPKHGGLIGIVANAFMYKPLRDNDFDRDAANRALVFTTAWVFDPLVLGDYPPEMRKYLGSLLPRFTSDERNLIKNSIDFIGINHYGTLYAKDCIYSSCVCSDSSCTAGGDHPIHGYLITLGEKDGVSIGERTGMPRFFVVPKGMEEVVDYMKKRYHNKPMFVTENGYSSLNPTTAQADELQHDTKRVEFHKAYLASLAQAIRNGADVRGYFIWSLMDNFEWARGYEMKFGLYYVDRATLDRVPKLSAKWYRDFLTNSSLNGEETGKAISFKNTQSR